MSYDDADLNNIWYIFQVLITDIELRDRMQVSN